MVTAEGVAHALVPDLTVTRTNQKKNAPSLPIRVRACAPSLFASLRKPRIARILCAIFKRDLSQRQFGPVVAAAVVVTITVIAFQHYIRDYLRTLPSRLVVLHPTRQPGQELLLARHI